MTEKERKRRRRRGGKREYTCVACQKTFTFCWNCGCGFAMCPACMQENLWGMSCNQITWTCPDCGAIRNFGNQ